MKPGILQILIIDDSEDDNFFTKRAISKSGVPTSVNVCIDGLDALDYLTGKGDYLNKEVVVPDLILLDINMPRMSGWEFLDSYHELSIAKLPILVIPMLSTWENPTDRLKAKDTSAIDSFISKPLTAQKVVHIATKQFGYSEDI